MKRFLPSRRALIIGAVMVVAALGAAYLAVWRLMAREMEKQPMTAEIHALGDTFNALLQAGELPGVGLKDGAEAELVGTLHSGNVRYPLAETIRLDLERDKLARFEYTFVKESREKAWVLDVARRVPKDGSPAAEFFRR